MADPVVHLTNGVPDSGTGNITTLGQTLLDGANVTQGAIADAAVTAGATGSISAKLRSISRDLVAATPAGTNLIGKVGIDQTTDGTTNAVHLTAGTNIIGKANVLLNGTTPDLGSGTAGTATQRVIIDSSQFSALGQSTSSASAPVVIASDQSAIPSIAKPSATANGQTSSRVNSAASTNATSLKASAGQVGEIDLANNAAYTVFLKFYNKASAPTVGTDTPVWTIPIYTGGGFSKSFPRGKTFSTGIAYAITKLQADSDTTVVVAGDLTGSIDWI